MVVLTNFLIFLVCLYYFTILTKTGYKYPKHIGLFVLFMGISSCFGSAGHTVQLQLGNVFFRTVLFISHAFNLASLYFCFRAAYTFFLFNRKPNKLLLSFVALLTLSMLILATISGTFIFVKIPAAFAMIYFLIVHSMAYRNKITGSGVVVTGILISFLSILVHSLRLSVSDWFNHKDIAHVIIAISLIIICRGVMIIVKQSNDKLLHT